MSFPASFSFNKIVEQAELEYPGECCGIVTGRIDRRSGERKLWPCRNLIDQYHREDPQEFPRSSRNGFLIDPSQLLQLQKHLRNSEESILFFYHSHIDTDAYLSQEDLKWDKYALYRDWETLRIPEILIWETAHGG